nr:hypothetical protein [Tanacetum cinerariifolium]
MLIGRAQFTSLYGHLSASIGYSQPLVNKILRNTVDFRNILKDKKRPVTMESLLVIDETLEKILSEVASMKSQPVIENADADVVQEENAGAGTGSTGDDVAGAATGSKGDGVQVEDAVADVVNRGRGRKLKRKKGQAEDANVVSRAVTRAQHIKQGICAPTNQLQ